MSDLKPCPFCSATPMLYDLLDTHGGFSVECPTVGCDTDKMKRTKAESIEAWNRRAQPAPITSESGNQAAQGASAITSETVPVLTDEEIQATYEKLCDTVGFSFSTMARAIEHAVRAKLGAGVPMTDQEILDAAKAIKAKRVEVAVKNTLDRVGSKCSQCGGVIGVDSNGYNTFNRCESCNHVPMFNIDGVEYRHHGIVGEEGGK